MDYDIEEMSVLNRMKRDLMRDHGWYTIDFEGMTFLDIESTYLDEYGYEDFR
jgi:hypothetical protein